MNRTSRKNPAEDFHTTKKSVLVCRTGPAFELHFFLQRDEKTGAIRSKIDGFSYSLNGSINGRTPTSRQGATW
jgi:hypothetical protein